MLKRIKLIKNIGIFHECQPSGVEFGNKTIVYGSNGDGKSTLTAIFRSLSTGNIAILKGRKSFGAHGNKKIEMVFGNESSNEDHVFEKLAWNQPYDSIYIFDTKFIYENIYEGESIEDEHKSNLHRVIIGVLGKKLIRDIDSITERLKRLEQNKRELNLEFNGSTFGNHFTFTEFIEIKKDDDIENKIIDKGKEITFAQQLSKPGEVIINSIDIDNLKTIIKKTFKSSHEEAEKKLREHIKKHWRDENHSTTFISDGLSLINDEEGLSKSTCPFCGQSLLPVENLIKNYQDYFNQEYEKFRGDLLTEVERFKRTNPAGEIDSAIAIVNSWRQYLGDDHSTNVIKHLNEKKKKLCKLKIEVERESANKIKDMNAEGDIKAFELFEREYEQLIEIAERHNEKVRDYIKAHVGKTVDELKKEIGKLRAIKEQR